jgi:tRNA pseudouridine65 synthase
MQSNIADTGAFVVTSPFSCGLAGQKCTSVWTGATTALRQKSAPRVIRRCRVTVPANSASASAAVAPAGEPVTILHLTDCYVVVSKPAGVMVHRSEELTRGDHREIRYLNEEVRRLLLTEHNMEHVDLNVVHRLDRATSGVMLFAFGSGNASAMQYTLQNGPSTRKEYWTVVRKKPDVVVDGMDGDAWTNSMPLKALNVPKRNVAVQQAASTSFSKLLALDCTEKDVTASPALPGELGDGDEFEPHQVWVVRAELASGRRHQIRRHLSFSRLPIFGDTSYGKGRHNRYGRAQYGFSRLALHSRRLTFAEPDGGPVVSYSAPVPLDLRNALARVPGWDVSLHTDMADLD